MCEQAIDANTAEGPRGYTGLSMPTQSVSNVPLIRPNEARNLFISGELNRRMSSLHSGCRHRSSSCYCCGKGAGGRSGDGGRRRKRVRDRVRDWRGARTGLPRRRQRPQQQPEARPRPAAALPPPIPRGSGARGPCGRQSAAVRVVDLLPGRLMQSPRPPCRSSTVSRTCATTSLGGAQSRRDRSLAPSTAGNRGDEAHSHGSRVHALNFASPPRGLVVIALCVDILE
jgi:hypothetical protein